MSGCIVRDEMKEYYGDWRLTSHVCREREGRGTQVVVFTCPAAAQCWAASLTVLGSSLTWLGLENIRLEPFPAPSLRLVQCNQF